MPTVSFLMSNYKTPPAFLRRALDSMLDQTFPDFEIVVVNDGVKDGSYEVLKEYAFQIIGKLTQEVKKEKMLKQFLR